MRKYFHSNRYVNTRKMVHIDTLDKWEGTFVELGRPFMGRYMKMGQNRTWDGWGVQITPKKWDVLCGCSLMEKS